MPEVPLPVVGPSNNAQADCQRSINLYTRKAQKGGEKAPQWHLVSAPGLSEDCDLTEVCRGALVMDGREFRVHGPTLYEIYSDGTTRNWGTIPSVEGRVDMAECVGTISIGDGSGFYSFDPTAGTIDAITDAPIGRHCIAFGQRILYHERESGRVYYSELNDPTNIPALNFFTAENRPDNLETLVATEDKIWLLGTDSTEAFYDSGDTDNPFQRIPGSVVFNGCLAGDTAVRTDNAIFMVGKNDDGDRQVFRIQGFQHVIISTHAVEKFLKTATNLTAFSWQEDGHTFYQVNADQGSWVYDVGEREWWERAWLNPNSGDLERARAEIHTFCYGIHRVSDYESGKVYRQSTSIYSDDGNPLLRRRIFPGPRQDGRRIVINELFIDMKTGVGLVTGQGSDPKVMLRYSVDGGMAWSYEMQADLGPIGDRTEQVRFRRLGSGNDWAFMVSVSDPVPVTIWGGTARGTVGRRG